RGAGRALESFQPGDERVEPLEARHEPPPGVCFFDRKAAGVYPGLGDRTGHHAEARDHGVVAECKVTRDSRRAADHAALADGRAAGNGNARREGAVRADTHVVADLDQVIELDAFFDDGVVDGATID